MRNETMLGILKLWLMYRSAIVSAMITASPTIRSIIYLRFVTADIPGKLGWQD
jgi:hypothetical protein